MGGLCFAAKKVRRSTAIADAFIVIDGESMTPVTDEAMV